MESVTADDRVRRCRQAGCSQIADDLTADVVAVPAVPVDLQLDAHAVFGLEIDQLGIDQIVAAEPRGARCDQLGGDVGVVVADQIACDVKFVDKRIGGRHIARDFGTAGRRKVAVLCVDDERDADVAAGDHLTQFAVVRVKPPHESDLKQALSGLLFGLHDAQTALRRVRKRLFAENIFPFLDGGDGESLVGRIPGCDHDRVHLIRPDEVIGVGDIACAAGLRDRACDGFVRVVDRGDLRARDYRADIFNVVLSHASGTDKTNAKRHNISLLCRKSSVQ